MFDSIYVERLTKLIEILENLPQELPKTNLNGQPLTSFNMSSWVCGTAACALGTAACHPYFQGQGLGVKLSEDGIFQNFTLNGMCLYIFDTAGLISQFFGISAREAEYLFLGDDGTDMGFKTEACDILEDMTPFDVASRCREVLAKHAGFEFLLQERDNHEQY